MSLEELIELAKDVLKVSSEVAAENNRYLEEENAYYFWKPERGGISMIMDAETGVKLAAGSSVGFEQLLEAYKSGKRN